MIRVANAPCSWGVLEFEGLGETAGCALVLEEIAATGYAGTELGDWGFMPTEPAALRAELSARRLALVGAFVPVRLADPQAHAPGVEVAVRVARLLAAASADRPVIVLADENGTDARRTARAGRIEPPDSLEPAAWETFAAGADLVAREVRSATGLATVFHPHCAGSVEAPWEVDELMARTDPALLGLCLDAGHLTYGGGDPVAIFERYAPRVWHVHYKDCHPGVAAGARREGWDYFTAVRRGIFCELGRGGVDFGALTRRLRETGYDGWVVVEQDVLPGMGSPAESARRNREFLRGLGL
jgi:inosose dehydratase